MSRVFLSYQRADFELARRIGELLRRESMEVWWDQDLTPREPWDRIIERELKAADFVLVLWSEKSINSDWVRAEAHYARSCQPSKLVQARFDLCQIPIAFSLIQYAELSRSERGRSNNWRRLVGWLSNPTGPPERRPPVVAPPTAKSRLTKHEMALTLNERHAWLEGKRIKIDFGREGIVTMDGVAGRVTEDDGAADTTIKVSWEDWQAMSDGKLDGMTAFMQGKLKVEGDMSNAMQLQGVLAKLRS